MSVRELINPLWTEFSRMDAAYREIGERFNLSHAELGILHECWFRPGSTQKDVVRLWAQPKQIVHNAAKSLIREGWIRAEKSTDDKRMQKLFLTEEGKREAEPIVTRFARYETSIFEAMGEPEIRKLTSLLRMFADIAEEKKEELE